jgi:DNA-binding protein H-NS
MNPDELLSSLTTMAQKLPPEGQSWINGMTRTEQLETARVAELEAVIAQTRQIVLEYGLTAEDIGLTSKSKKKAGKKTVAAKYMDPKTGVTWSGRGRAPAWIEGKNRVRFLIK